MSSSLANNAAANPFLRLSYFEVILKYGFISRFSTTQSVYNTPMPTIDDEKMFRDTAFISDDTWACQFDVYFKTLAKHNFGINDIFWWLPNTNEAVKNAETLWKYISNAVIELGEITPNIHQSVTIKNKLHPEFSVPGFYKNTPLPQEAIDVVPFFKTGEGMSGCFTALGYKKESNRVPVTLSSGVVIDVLTVGIHGNVIFGEHLDEHEKKLINNIRDEFLRTQNPVSIPREKGKISAVMRTLTEEAGITAVDCEMMYVDFSRTLLGEKCRDDRYGELVDDDGCTVYGYPRASSAHTVCCVFHCNPPTNPIPTDQDECSKPTILTVEAVKNHFCIDGKFRPAFPSHVKQMSACIKYVESM